jgi:hypothetical protein
MNSLSDRSLVPLPLDPLSPRLPINQPFTPAMAARAGIGRAVLDRLHREGRVQRLLRGVYIDATVPTTRQVRARALALVVGEQQVVVGLTAAWLHGVVVPPADPGAPAPVEVRGRACARRDGRPVRYAGHDLESVDGVRATTALRTALDLGRQLAPDRAIAALDGLLALGAFSHTALMAELPRFAGQPGIGQLRELAALADGRAAGAAESVLRLHWLQGPLPTPTPGLRARGVRLALGLDTHRFGAVLDGRLSEAQRTALPAQGWRVVVLPEQRVLHGDPAYLVEHLEREFHLHLLDQVG